MNITNSHCPDTLEECANQLAWLVQSDGMRQFFDDNGTYDSAPIFNLLSLLEEVANSIEKGNYSDAESMIDSHYRCEIKRVLNPIATHYCEKDDMTFIMQEHYNAENNLVKQECIGWYHGKPEKIWIEKYKGSLSANYLE